MVETVKRVIGWYGCHDGCSEGDKGSMEVQCDGCGEGDKGSVSMVIGVVVRVDHSDTGGGDCEEGDRVVWVSRRVQ